MGRPLKICIVATYDLAEEGGVKRHAVKLAEELRRLGDHVDVVGPYSGKRPLPPGMIGLRGVINIPSNGSDNRMGIFNCPWRVWQLLRDGKYDVLHVHEPAVPSLAWYAAWFAHGAARVATFHAFAEEEGWRSRAARRIICAPQLRLFDRAIAVSPAAARFAEVAWPRPLALIPNGIDTQSFRPPSSSDEARRPGPPRLLFVGHWRDPRKGLPTLLEAHERLRAAGVEVELDIIGKGPDEARVVRPGLTYRGGIGDEATLARFYRNCDVFVAPSTGMESFGIVLLEAMATARPIVCSDIEGYRAVVPADGARLCPPGDAARLADAIAELVRNEPLRRKMGETNLRASVAFDWSHVAARVRDEYLQALGEPSGSDAQATPPAATVLPRRGSAAS